MVVVAISGPHGAGKTTAAQALAKRFKQLKYICAGEIFRQLAEERKMSLCEFSKYTERHPEIDRMIDRRSADAARGDKVLIDARLAGWMAKKADLKILITAPLKVRVNRITQREGHKVHDVYLETLRRERSEAKRFKKLYKVDIYDYSPFDVILNTERISRYETAKILGNIIDIVMKRRR